MDLRIFNCRAQWITMAEDDTASPLFRKEFETTKPASKVICKVSGLGSYIISIDGNRIGNSILEPRFSNYSKSVYYNMIELPPLDVGKHAIGVTLGRSRRAMLTKNTWGWHNPPWDTARQLVVQIDIYYDNGTFACIRSDNTWKYAYGPVRFDCLYAGEKYDANHEAVGWDTVGFDDSSWNSAIFAREPEGRLVLQESPPIVPIRKIKPTKLLTTGKSSRTYEFSENVSGNIVLRTKGRKDSKVVIRYGEKINDDLTVNSEYFNVSSPLQEDTYTFKDDNEIEYCPIFTYKGYQYVEIIKDPVVEIIDVTGLVYHNDIEKRGSFKCSSASANQLHENSVRALLSNLHHTPTDTPIYEKNGWTGDAQLTSMVAMYNFDVNSLYSTWMNDFADSQLPNGEIPPIIPSPNWGYSSSDFGWEAAKPALPAWDAAYFEIINNLHMFYGSNDLIDLHFEKLEKYLEYLDSCSDDYIIKTGLGDWLAPNGEDHSGELLQPDENHLSSTAYYFRMSEILSKFARIIGNNEKAAKYENISENIKNAFNDKYLDIKTGIYSPGKNLSYRQTPNIMALAFGLVPEKLKDKTLEALVHDISVIRSGHLWTGIIGTRYILDVLTDNGYTDLAFSLIECTTYPSWGYWFRNGATSLYETWELDTRSRNHHMFGSVDSWFYEYLCGLCPTSPGFASVMIKPYFPTQLSEASASYYTGFGDLSVSWVRMDRQIHLSIVIPPGTDAIFCNTRDIGRELKLDTGLNKIII